MTIRWTSSGALKHDLSYSADGGGTWPPIVGGLACDAVSYDWTPPAALKDAKVKVRVTVTNNSGDTVSSDSGVFTVNHPAAAPTVARPGDGGDVEGA